MVYDLVEARMVLQALRAFHRLEQDSSSYKLGKCHSWMYVLLNMGLLLAHILRSLDIQCLCTFCRILKIRQHKAPHVVRPEHLANPFLQYLSVLPELLSYTLSKQEKLIDYSFHTKALEPGHTTDSSDNIRPCCF